MKAKTSLLIRFAICLTIYSLISIPTLVLPRRLLFKYKYPFFNFLYRLASKIRVYNLSDKPFEKYQAVIYASNHKSFADFCLITSFLKNPYSIMIKKEMTDNIFFKFLSWRAGLIPIDRNDAVSQLKALKAAINMINTEKYSLIMFPEGWYNFDKPIGELKSGINKIARETKADVVPIAIYGIKNDFYQYGKLKWKDTYIKAGEPINYYDFKDRKDFSKTLELKIKNLYTEIENEVSINS